MNKQQRNQWDKAIEMVYKIGDPDGCTLDLLKAADAYILKLERELQNIKQGKRIAAILMPHGGPR